LLGLWVGIASSGLLPRVTCVFRLWCFLLFLSFSRSPPLARSLVLFFFNREIKPTRLLSPPAPGPPTFCSLYLSRAACLSIKKVWDRQSLPGSLCLWPRLRFSFVSLSPTSAPCCLGMLSTGRSCSPGTAKHTWFSWVGTRRPDTPPGSCGKKKVPFLWRGTCAPVCT